MDHAHPMPFSPPGKDTSGPYPMGLLALVATVAMLFAAFTAALLIRRAGSDWVVISLPPIVGANTLVLVISSAAVEMARRAVRGDQSPLAAGWLFGALVLGALFLAGQLAAWWSLVQAGVFLPSSPHASFFYMLSAVHGAHVVGGLGALVWVFRRTRAGAYTANAHGGLSHAAVFWHFMGVIWVYLLALLTLA